MALTEFPPGKKEVVRVRTSELEDPFFMRHFKNSLSSFNFLSYLLIGEMPLCYG
jgi:hypothetical protein